MTTTVVTITVIIVIIIILIFAVFSDKKVEGADVGALVQLYAKDQQDEYLTDDAWKYIPPWFSNPYVPTYMTYNYRRQPLYAPTRAGRLNYYYYRPYGLKNYR